MIQRTLYNERNRAKERDLKFVDKYMLKRRATKRAREGFPLLTTGDFVQERSFSEGAIIECVDEHHHFIAKAYLAKQHKGDGWVLTTDPKEAVDLAFFEKRFRKALEARSLLEKDEGTTAYRYFNGEGDGVGGLTIDRYADFYVFSWYSLGIYKHREMIIAAFKAAVPSIDGLYQKIRFEHKNANEKDHIFGKQAPVPLLVTENGIRYAVYLDDGLMTGIFLDQRHIRQSLLEKYAAGNSVLNTFSYTGAFSVAAAMGGAIDTTSVDLAKRSLMKTREQFEVNGINPDDQTIHVMDVFDYIRYALRKALTFDVVILDPPSFARSKKRTFSVARDYADLLADMIALTNPGGMIIASMNAANVTAEKMEQFIEKAFSAQNCSYTVEESYSLPEDFTVHPQFKQGDYLKVYFLRKGN